MHDPETANSVSAPRAFNQQVVGLSHRLLVKILAETASRSSRRLTHPKECVSGK